MTVAVNNRTKKTLYRGDDPGAALQAAIDEATVAGGTVTIAPGSYRYKQTVPTFRAEARRWVIVRGTGATIILSAAAPRAFDARADVDGAVFRRIWIEGVSIDAASVGGNQHTVFGNRIDGASRRRTSFDGVVLRKIHARGILTSVDAGRDSRFGVALDLWHPRSGEPEASFARNVEIEGVHLDGGNSGIMITADAPDAERAPNVYIDNLRIEGCSHTLGGFPKRFFASSNIHVGNMAKVGVVIIRDNYAEFAGDDGIEINNADLALILNNTLRDQWNVGYYAVNYNQSFDPSGQLLVLAGNISEITGASDQGEYARGFILQALSPRLGTVLLEQNQYELGPQDNSQAHALAAWGPIANLEVVNFRARFDRVLYLKERPTWHAPLVFEIENVAARSSLVLKGVELDYTVELDEYAAARGASINPYLMFVAGEDLYLDIADVSVRAAASNFGPGSNSRIEFVTIGRFSREALPVTTVRGRIRRISASLAGDDEDPVGILIGSTVSSESQLTFKDCELGALPVSATAFAFEAPPEAPPRMECADGSPLGPGCLGRE